MSKKRPLLALFYLLACVLGGVALAQAGPGNPGRAGGGMYNPATVETITGEVLAVDLIAPGKGKAGGVHLSIKTDKEEIAVHLGPKWYVDEQGMKLAAKDRVEVRGSRITFEGKPVIIAAEVKKGDQLLKLRDEGGMPLWRGSGRRKK